MMLRWHADPVGGWVASSRPSCDSPWSLFSLLPQVFEEDTTGEAELDVWINVQRRWVYLEGNITGSADIKHLMPNETQLLQRYFISFFVGKEVFMFSVMSCTVHSS